MQFRKGGWRDSRGCRRPGRWPQLSRKGVAQKSTRAVDGERDIVIYTESAALGLSPNRGRQTLLALLLEQTQSEEFETTHFFERKLKDVDLNDGLSVLIREKRSVLLVALAYLW